MVEQAIPDALMVEGLLFSGILPITLEKVTGMMGPTTPTEEMKLLAVVEQALPGNGPLADLMAAQVAQECKSI